MATFHLQQVRAPSTTEYSPLRVRGQFKVLYIAGDGQPCPKDTAVIDLNMAVRPPAALQVYPSFVRR